MSETSLLQVSSSRGQSLRSDLILWLRSGEIYYSRSVIRGTQAFVAYCLVVEIFPEFPGLDLVTYDSFLSLLFCLV